MKILSRQEQGVHVVTVKGNLFEPSTADSLERYVDGLLRQGSRNILLDVSAVLHTGEAGLGAIVNCLKLVKGAGGTLKMMIGDKEGRSAFQRNPVVRQVMDQLFEHVEGFDSFENEEDAIRSFTPDEQET